MGDEARARLHCWGRLDFYQAWACAGSRTDGADLLTFPAMPLREALAAFADVIPLSFRTGQILVYPRHLPPGVFVVVEGTLHRFTPGGPSDGERIDAASGPLAIPDPSELDEPAEIGIVADSDVRILFIPRSVVLRDGSIARLLTAAGVPAVPLGHRRAG